MPTYPYRCRICGKSFERSETISEHENAKAHDYSGPKVAARIRRLAVGLALILLDIGFPRSPALADDASALMGTGSCRAASRRSRG